MKRLHAPVAAARRVRGLTLIELLVSLTIGLALMIAIVSAYLGSASASRMAEAQGRMNEDAQAALSILSQQLRMAGNNPKRQNYAPDTPRNPAFSAADYAIRGCDGAFSNVATAGSSIAALICTATGPDSIAVAYEADANNTIKNAAGDATDCIGQALPVTPVPVGSVTPPQVKMWNAGTGAVEATAVSFALADNRFYIANTSGIPNLYCRGNGGGGATAGQPLVENVEDLQITYGVAPIAAVGTLTVAGYLTAKEVEDDEVNLQTLADDPLRWSKVATARICIVVRSEQPVAPDAASAQYYQCDGTLDTTPPDLRLRRAYTTTVVLRNRLAS